MAFFDLQWRKSKRKDLRRNLDWRGVSRGAGSSACVSFACNTCMWDSGDAPGVSSLHAAREIRIDQRDKAIGRDRASHAGRIEILGGF